MSRLTAGTMSRLTAGTMCLRLKSFRWQPMFIAVNHAFTASCNAHYPCDTMPQYLIEQCLPQFVHDVSTSNHFDTIFVLMEWRSASHPSLHCDLAFRSLKFDVFFFNLKQFDTIWCGHFLRTCNAFNAAMPNSRMRQIGHSPRSARPQNLRGWWLYRFWPTTNATNATASYSFIASCVCQMCRICLSLPRTHRKVLAWHAHNVGQIVHTNYTLGLAKCDHCDNMWHALYCSYVHAPIFSAVQLARFLELPRCFSGFASATTAPTVATRYHTLLLVIGCNLVFLFQVHSFATSLPLAF